MTDSEKLDIMNKRLKRMEINSHIHLAVLIIGFLGIVSVGQLIRKLKK